MRAQIVTHPQADLAKTERYYFRRRVKWDGAGSAELFVYADTRYRLFVNGRLVTTGPVRSVPGGAGELVGPRFDRVPLTPWLAPGGGPATVVVEVLVQRANNFQAMPGTPGGFAAWGRVGDASLATPGEWQVWRDASWTYPSPHFSFAQGPVEVSDLRQLPVGVLAGDDGVAWTAPAPVPDADAHYRPFRPADLPLPSMQVRPFVRAWDLGLAIAGEARVAATVAEVGRPWRESRDRPRFAWATLLHAPRAQDVEVGLFWGPNYLNGQEVKAARDPHRGNRQNATLALRAGWNVLYGEPEFFGPVWGVMLGWPRDGGLTVRGAPSLDDPTVLRVSPLMSAGDLRAAIPTPPADPAAVSRVAGTWRAVRGDEVVAMPGRDVAWDRFDPGARREVPPGDVLHRHLKAGDVWAVVYDMGEEYLGFPVIDVDGPAGTTVDVAYEERLRADGAVELYSSNPFTDMAERWVLDGTRRTIEPSQPRGGRMVQITVRAADDGPVAIHRAAHRDVKRPAASMGRLEGASDDLLAWAFDVSRRTIEATLEDGYVDPWRERGLYLGDSYVAGLSHVCLTPDPRHAAHALRVFAAGQRPDGQLPCVVPAWLREPHEDFTLIYVDWLTEHYRVTGDVGLVADCLPAIKRMWAGSRWVVGESGLYTGKGMRVFLDWGVHPPNRVADDNACLNALRYRALLDTARLLEAVGEPAEVDGYLAQAAAVRSAYNERLWAGDDVGFAIGMIDGKRSVEQNAHANVLALWSGIADGPRQPRLLAVVERQMAANAKRCATAQEYTGMVELYFLRFAAEAFARVGRVDLGLRVLRDHFAVMRELGLVMLPEAIHRAVENKASLCHCWGGWPVEFITRRVVGVQPGAFAEAGHVRVAPDFVDVATGRLTVPVGPGRVTVAWDQPARRATVTLDGLTGGRWSYRGRETPLSPGGNELAW